MSQKQEPEKIIMKQRIDIIINQIDALVKKIYGLTVEEIKNCEGKCLNFTT